MSQLEKEVTKYMIVTDSMSVEAVEASKSLVQIVNEGSVQENLLRLIQALGEYLTSDDEFVRAKATGLLSNTLTHCEHDAINESAVSVLVDFYCERLTDTTCVPHLLEGLEALTKFTKFSGKNAVFVSKRVFQHVQVQQFPQGTRYAAFMLFNNLIDRQVNALKSINNEFIYGFTHIVDGEKDPRNLMAAFKIMTLIIQHFDISTHVEDIFEVTFCYFPITFKPPPDDPYGISAEDLKTSLRKCISSTPLFAKFAVPLILEKLSSTSGSAKKDSMETMAACAPVYGASALLPHINDIFSSLKVEVFHAIEPALEDAAVDAIRSVVSALGSAAVNASEADPTEKALKPLVDECATNLRDPDMKDGKQTGRVLKAIASASDGACHFIVERIVPLVLKQYRETNAATLKKANVGILIDLLEASKTLYGAAHEEGNDLESPLIEHKDRFFGIFEASLTSSNEYNLLRLSGLTGLKLMIMSKHFLKSNEIGIAVQSFNKILLDEQDEELVSAALDALCVTSTINSQYINELTIPSLIERLPDTSSHPSKYMRVLYALKALLPEPSVYQFALPLLVQKFDTVCEKDNDLDYAFAIINSILAILKEKVTKKHKDIADGISTHFPHFIKRVVEASVNQEEENLILNPMIIKTIALILIQFFTQVDSSVQKVWLDKVFDLFVHGKVTEFGVSNDKVFRPLDVESSDERTTPVFAAIVCSLRKDVVLPVTHMEDYLNELVTLALNSHATQVTSVSRMIGSLVNKWKDNAALTEYVQSTALILEDAIVQHNNNALDVYLWMTKALVLRAHVTGYNFTEKIIGWCKTNVTGTQAPKGFHILIGEDELCLTKQTFATMTILYKQRFFSFCLPKLVEGFRSSSDEIKPNFLIALSYILKNVPHQILLNELPPLVPLLIQSLELKDVELRVSTLETLKLAVSEAPNVIGPQIRTLLPSLLGLFEEDEYNSIRVRVAALQSLAEFPVFISKDYLLPHMNYVIRQLKKPLDDKKRMVRKEAVDCRAKWYTMK